AGLAQLPPARDALLALKAPGAGPTPAQRERGWFRVRIVGQAPGARVVTEVAGGDPGYGETSKMLAQSALCLALDDLPRRAGQLTPAVAMGQALIDRLVAVGIEFRISE
ncbi:MAG: saccharopine dehydrogenase, partial [Solirubrobacteraceae bacterium]